MIGVVCLHVDDLFCTGNPEFKTHIVQKIKDNFKVGHEDRNDVEFTGQRITRVNDRVEVNMQKCIDDLHEIEFNKGLADSVACTSSLHTEYRSVLGMINWLQSRTQFHVTYLFSRCASASASPTIGDCRALYKVVRTVRAQPVKLIVHPVK